MKRGYVYKGQMPIHGKSKGTACMVSEIVGETGPLKSIDGKKTSRVLLTVGKCHEGYFDNDQLLFQVSKAMALMAERGQFMRHYLYVDNAPSMLF